MTLQEVLSTTDELKANMMSTATKVRFISEIEGRVHQEILMKHQHTEEEETLPVYDDNTDLSTTMLVPAPYDMLYVYWLMSKIDISKTELLMFDQFTWNYNLLGENVGKAGRAGKELA